MTASFVHLHVHSHYSLLNASIRLDELCRRVAAHGAPAVALTDDDNLFGAVEFCRAAEAAGIRPILGCDLAVAPVAGPPERPGQDPRRHRLVLLAENERGYRSLIRLVSRAYVDSPTGQPTVAADLLLGETDGLIALDPAEGGQVARALAAGRGEEAVEAGGALRDAFGADSFFLELVDHGRDADRSAHGTRAELAARLGVRTVAANDCRFLGRDDFEGLRALTCIGTGTTLDDPAATAHSPTQYLRSPEEMAELFADWPEALAATVEIAERCRFTLEPREPLLPEFRVPEGESIESFLRERSRAGLDERRQEWAALPATARREISASDYDARLERELDVIRDMGFPGYFLITWDVIRHARERGIPVGPGRGSAAGSLVAYCLRITDVDPLQQDLLFERFLNPERKSLPDIDIDFCQRRREEVIRYVRERYGESHVAQIITFGALNARSVIRDVGRVMNMTYGEVDRIAKMVPEQLGVTLDKALEDSPGLSEAARSDERVGRLLDTARSLEGLARNAGVHAAGVIIAPRPLLELAPLFKTGRNEVTTQFAKDEAEFVGLLKMDFLGLKTLTVLHDTLESVTRAGHAQIRLEGVPLDDARTFELFQQARTAGVFQFESSGMRDVLRKMRPETYDDLTALNALYRPGPLGSGMVDMFVDRRHGRVKVSYPHPALEPILRPTYGVMVFQEQVMRAAVELAGFSLGEADILRKAMGKKQPEVMAAQREKFIKGAVDRGIPQAKATEIFELMEYFAGYGFNKSHSAAYALVAYWCAYLKAHHPAHFMAALLTSDRENTAKIVRYIAECKEMGIEVRPPDVNESDVDFTAVSDEAIRFGLSAIKGVGRGAVESILEARQRAGRFSSLFSFCAEIDLRLNNKKVLEALVKAGALDTLGAGRSTLMFSIDKAVEHAQAAQADRQSGQASLFGAAEESSAENLGTTPELPPMPEWPRGDRLRNEKEVLGFYVSGHPLEDHADVLASLMTAPLAELAEHGDREVKVAGIVTALRRTRTRRGDWMAFVTIEDLTGHVEVVVFPDAWKECEKNVEADAALCVHGKVEAEGERAKLLASKVEPLGTAERQAAQGLLVRLPDGLTGADLETTLARADDAFSERPGTCPVSFELAVARVGRVRVLAGQRYRVDPEPELIASLEEIVGAGSISLVL